MVRLDNFSLKSFVKNARVRFSNEITYILSCKIKKEYSNLFQKELQELREFLPVFSKKESKKHVNFLPEKSYTDLNADLIYKKNQTKFFFKYGLEN